MKTISAKASDFQRKWYVIDAENQILGKVAEKAARLLRGKDKPNFTPHVDCGDYVIVINAEKVAVTGKKETQKEYQSVSGYIGSQKRESLQHRRERHPELIIEHAVRGMIPHNRLGRSVYTKLKVYKGSQHDQAAQQPELISL